MSSMSVMVVETRADQGLPSAIDAISREGRWRKTQMEREVSRGRN